MVAALEVAVVGLAALPIGRVALDRRLNRIAPRLRVLAGACVVGAMTFATALAFAAPTMLHALAIVAIVSAAAAFVHARPRYGAGRGWPRGSLSVTRSLRVLGDRNAYRSESGRHGPIFKTAQVHQPTVCVVGLERGHRLLRDHDQALTSAPLPFAAEIPGGFLRYMDPETHSLYGPLFRRALSPEIVDAAEAATREATQRELARAADDATARDGVAPSDYTARIVDDAFLRCLFGIEVGDETAAEFERAYEGLARHDIAAPLSSAGRSSLEALRALVLRLINDEPETTSAAHQLRRLDAQQPDVTALDNLLFTMRISTANIVGLLDWTLFLLGRNPTWIDRLGSEVDSGAGRELADRVVMETLRLGQSEYVYRTLSAPVEFEGYNLPRGWLVRLCVAESHLDPAVYPDPERFDPDRFLERHDSSRYSPFGWGRHLCNGVTLTHMVSRVVLEELAGGYSWTVSGGEPPAREPRHWRHWHPADDLRLRIAPRDVGGEKD